ncbi:MAG: hypothetical protein AAGI50_08550 [Pseudomonadota bacterium]
MTNRTTQAALAALAILHGVMLTTLLAGVEPHPPAAVAPFGMAPFLAVVLAAVAAAAILGTRWAVVSVALLSLVSFGPQKVLDPAFGGVWPAILAAQISIIALLYDSVAQGLRRLKPS